MLEKTLKFFTYTFFFLLPWQTIWIYRDPSLNGSKWEYGVLGFYATEVLLWVVIGLFMVWFFKKSKIIKHKFKINFSWSKDRLFAGSFLLCILYILASTLWAPDSSLALQHAVRMIEAILFFFVLFLGPFNTKKILRWFVAGAVIQSVLGIGQFLTQSSFSSTIVGIAAHPVWQAGTSVIQSGDIGRWLRAYGGFSHPNVLGGFLTVSLMATFFLQSKVISQTLPAGRQESKVIVQTMILLQAAALFFTFSRSAWIAMVSFLVVYVYVKKKEALIKLLPSLGLILILILIFLPQTATRLGFIESSHEVVSVTERMSGLSESWQLFKQSPLLGVGVGNYTLAAYHLNPSYPGYMYQPVHNLDLLLLTELGIIGEIILIIVLFTGLRFMLSISKEGQHVFRVLVLSLIPYACLALFDHYLYSSYIGLMLTALYVGIGLRYFTRYPLLIHIEDKK